MLTTRPLILASQSPRRSQLLEQAGYTFTVKARPIDESFPEDMPVREVPEYLARNKAEAVRDFITADEIVLTADSVVILDHKIYGKPRNEAEAYATLRELSGRMHTVVTGVCLMDKERMISFAGVSDVHMGELTEEEIKYYVTKHQPFDKAGGYAVQEWIGLCKIHRIEGTYANIMGLPTDLVYEHLQQFG